MTQHANETASARFRSGIGGDDLLKSPLAEALSSFHSLLNHVAIMFGVTAGLTLLNLVADPDGLWSRAILVIWLVLLIAHAVGILIVRLLSDDTTTSSKLPRLRGERYDGPMSSWQRAMVENPSTTSGAQDDPEATAAQERADPWKHVVTPNGVADISWPEPPVVDSEVDRASFKPTTKPDDDGERSERVPWRAATEIAWMRRRRGAEGESASGRQDSAS
ncbi:MAG: hypothetical protein ACR2GS_11595 [Thermomicrobiales bacterium]